MLEIGTIIDNKYKILTVIGHGGMSTVYLAMNERANKQWAIKEIRKDKEAAEVRKSIENEINIMKKLEHPYLPSIIDVIDHMDSFLIVMDYVQGNTLLQVLREYGKQSVENVVDWCLQLCDVLGYLHSREPAVIYRDIKPGNIMLRPDGTIALIDFGIAREYKYDNYEDTTCLGTYGYAAPEQFGGMGQTDGRTDIYSLGMTAWHLLTGINPCEATCNIEDIRDICPDITEGMAKILIKCTRKNADERYSSCEELQYDLANYEKLDDNYRKKQIVKLSLIAGCTLIAIVAMIMAGIFKSKLADYVSKMYEMTMLEAVASDTVEAKVDRYDTAIMVDPTDEKAYIELLDNVYLADDIFSADEDEQLRQIFITSVEGKTCLEHLEGNAKGYATFAYKLGLAYFYCYEENGNRAMATKWLNIALNSGYLSESQYKRTQILCKLSEINNIGSSDRMGDNKYSYGEYWEDLDYLIQDDMLKDDNITTSLIVYRDFLNQVVSYAKKFQLAGVEKEDILSDIDMIEDALNNKVSDEIDPSDERLVDLYEQSCAIVSLARQSVENAYM